MIIREISFQGKARVIRFSWIGSRITFMIISFQGKARVIRKPQYQLCYIDPGIASGEEVELFKTVDSVFLEL
ncbi:hypothetical protein M0R45_038403 [Rubus argutus]|uniref:Uncharacterized protein n=1 Tax=Rubus argutus TaxID=59490 RepID=A0AAW1W294_RUBAR